MPVGTSFNDLFRGHALTFELFESPVSDPRALRVEPGATTSLNRHILTHPLF
jgi:hypothetical protein